MTKRIHDASGLSKDNAPEQVWNDAIVKTIKGSYFSLDIVLAYLIDKFSLLSSVALSVLTILRSNAVQERVFSMTKKNKTIFRLGLNLKTLVNSLIIIKMN